MQTTPDDLGRRFASHKPKDESTGFAHANIRNACWAAAQLLVTLVPPGRERALALTKLEEAMMWGNAGLARNPGWLP